MDYQKQELIDALDKLMVNDLANNHAPTNTDVIDQTTDDNGEQPYRTKVWNYTHLPF